jgi:hypothetical protein
MIDDPNFAIEPDDVGSGFHVTVEWPDGGRESIAGFSTQADAARWISRNSAQWLTDRKNRNATDRG